MLRAAAELPEIEIIHLESPSAHNPIGVEGAGEGEGEGEGEGGTIPAAACVISAIEDALSPFDIRISEHPVSPGRILERLRGARRT